MNILRSKTDLLFQTFWTKFSFHFFHVPPPPDCLSINAFMFDNKYEWVISQLSISFGSNYSSEYFRLSEHDPERLGHQDL